MTARHVSQIYFDGKSEYTKKRLQQIKAAGLVSERRRRVNDPSILFLTRKAFNLLNFEGQLYDYPTLSTKSFVARANVSELTLRHELEVMDVKAAFHSAFVKAQGLSLIEFSTWPHLNEFKTTRPGGGKDFHVKPDGFIRFHEEAPGTKGAFYESFLEVDRSSENQGILVRRISAYLEYYRSGDFAVRNGAERTEITKFPFRVLIVLKSSERRNNTAMDLLQHEPPILKFAWLTTLAEVAKDPLGSIWILPADYRDATNGTRFSTDQKRTMWHYKPQPERETLIEEKVKKHLLLG
jgi:hypothetical protein